MTFKNFKTSLFEPVNATNIDVFKRCFAICIFILSWGFYSSNIINLTFIQVKTHLPFGFASFLPLLPGKLMHLVILVQLIAALLLFTTKYSRQGALLFFVSFSYLFVIDISYYNNHFYFTLLLCLFFIFYKPLKVNNTFYVPKILLFLFRFQVVVVYFFGGVAKLNPDWLIHLEPMREILSNTQHNWPEATIKFYAYAGTLFDLLIGFLLLFPRTLKLGIVLNVLFHVSNYFMFETGKNLDIGVFPVLMICTNFLFLDGIQLQNYLSRFLKFYKFVSTKSKKSISVADFKLSAQMQKTLIYMAIFYFALQLLLPLRHYAIQGNVDWTSEGYFFAWRMKIRSKKNTAVIKIQDGPKGKVEVVNPYNFVNTLQFQAICDNPSAMYYFVQDLKKMAPGFGVKDARFYVSWSCSMNGHPAQMMVDSTIDFTTLKHRWLSADDWILPFH